MKFTCCQNGDTMARRLIHHIVEHFKISLQPKRSIIGLQVLPWNVQIRQTSINQILSVRTSRLWFYPYYVAYKFRAGARFVVSYVTCKFYVAFCLSLTSHSAFYEPRFCGCAGCSLRMESYVTCDIFLRRLLLRGRVQRSAPDGVASAQAGSGAE
jgi:hypothetical protein